MAKKPSGAQARKKSGRKPMWVTLEPADKKVVEVAASLLGIPASTFIQDTAINAAKKILSRRGLTL
jgi:uncharacterized protein (DUF1778 family)